MEKALVEGFLEVCNLFGLFGYLDIFFNYSNKFGKLAKYLNYLGTFFGKIPHYKPEHAEKNINNIKCSKNLNIFPARWGKVLLVIRKIDHFSNSQPLTKRNW